MFTGLVEETGKIVSIENAGEGKRMEVEAGDFFEDSEVGDSINISGACLTVEGFTESGVEIFLAEETLEKTWFSELDTGDRVNLEKSLTPEDRMGGHYVQGHVDTTAEIKQVQELEEGWNFWFSLPENLDKYIVEKGFIAVEGISLTVVDVEEDSFSVTIIPETWNKTDLSVKEEGDKVNLEVDVMAKYAEKASRYQD